MKFNDILKLSMNSLVHRRLRSWLTILGIVIGVAAVVAILSIGSGMQQSVSAQLGGLGADTFTISPGFSRASGSGFGGLHGGTMQITSNGQNLTDRDIQIVKSVSGVKVVNGIVSGRVEITYLAEDTSVSVQGVDPLAWREMTTSKLESGRYLTPGDGNVIVIGNRIAWDMFKQPLSINRQINIEGKSFKIVGILEGSGSFGGFGGDDNTIFMPISAARTIIEDMGTNQFSSIQVKVTNPEQVDEVIGSVEERLMVSRHVTEDTKDFTVSSAQAIQETISGVIGTLNLFLGGIAAISLLVGAIGIANSMFTSVMERTRQIGVLKALGTTNFEIMKLFLTESAIIGLVGGLMGIFIGFIASGITSEMGTRMIGPGMMGGGGSMTLITPELVLFAIGFSVFIGIAAGLIPARKAAKLQPVEAMRYE